MKPMTKLLWKSVKQLENKNGILYFDNYNSVELAKKQGTPLYIYSENRIRENYRRLVSAYTRYYPKFKVYYAIKANNNPAIINILRSEGCGADCSCVSELMIAAEAGVSPEDTLYSGVYNSNDELRYAVDHKVKLNLEDVSQLERLEKMNEKISNVNEKMGKGVNLPTFLCFRINPGMGSSGAEGLIFAGQDAKFGIIERDVKKAYQRAKQLGVQRFGIHMMTGSNILTPEYFEQVVTKLLDIAGPIARELNIRFEFIDIGGSLGVPYKPEQEEIDIDDVARRVVSVFRKKLKQYNLGQPYLIHEPGRYLVCDAGMLLTSITSIKHGYKTFVGVDAGMNTLLRPALYNAYHHILYANNLDAPADETVTVVGQICENTDQLAKDRLLPSTTNIMKVGDVLALLNAGAYGFGMSSQYNTRPRAAEILVNNGRADIIRKRENFKDLMHGVVVPKRLL